MSTPGLRLSLQDQSLPEEGRAFVRAVVKLLADTRGIQLEECSIQERQPGSTLWYLTCQPPTIPLDSDILIISTPDDFLTHLAVELDARGRSADASTLRYVLDLCHTETERGGLGFPVFPGVDWSLNQTQRQGLRGLLEAWLESLNSAERARGLHSPLSVRASSTRPMTLAEKILAHHAFSLPSAEGLKGGDFIRVTVDWIIASELSWVGMKHSMTSIGEEPTVWRNDRFWLAGDHTVDPRTYHQPRVRELIDGMHDAKTRFKMTENQGSNFTILHTEFVRERAEPGMLVLGSDSHTCSAGAVSSLAIGLGAADVMAALATGETWIKTPESIRVEFVGAPAWYIRGKDVILYILKTLKRNTHAADRIVEFGGPGARHLSCDARFAICNMCTVRSSGYLALCAQFISDRPQARYRTQSLYFQPDADASYAATFRINLEEVESFIALYPSPDNVVPVTEKVDMRFEGCFIGACTTTEEDLILGALVLEAGLQKGLPLARGKRMVVPGSLPIVSNLRALGLLDIYAQAGFTLPAVSCSLCLGMGADRAGSGENWLSSQNRNFKNRMGPGSTGHICSAAVVAASSFSMQLTDPRPLLRQVSVERYQTLLASCRRMKADPRGKLRERLKASANPAVSPPMPPVVEPYLSVRKTTTPSTTTSIPGLEQEKPHSAPAQITRSGVSRLGDFVDTDAIIPAAFILESPTDVLLGSHCLELTHPEFRDQVRAGLDVVVAGKAFGCGSSREEAPRALKGLGVKCVIARSFSFIYGRNQPTIGLLGLTITDDDFYAAAQTGVAIEIDLPRRQVTVSDRSYPFVLDEMELALIQRQGLAAAYKMFGKTVFQSLCNDHGSGTVPASALAEMHLGRRQAENRGNQEVLAW
ncbi:aconitase family protein [Aspergillus aculeatinus CBS 121060]|uniref:Aconitase family protein n=1 Tax=Aspergillus aculeatinus CBS 121060 TaxID=1448322 RepID=A0ACD1HAD8_9EURO|nr:aconitase family protein [Aspergillus aculeatinus CBS 121060]RAH70345.1 aconitase family protein [Aspergillus aculeatinus CBS 121060]